MLAVGHNLGGLAAVQEDTEDDNDEEVGDGDQEINETKFISKVKSDCDLPLSCDVSSSDKISKNANLIVQEKDKSKIVKAARGVCDAEDNLAFRINNNIWKCELEINI